MSGFQVEALKLYGMSIDVYLPMGGAAVAYDRPMPERRSPTLRRRRLSAELRRLREAAGISVAQAAQALECSPDKIMWIERAEWVRPNPRDVRDLLDRYGVADQPQREELLRLAREGGQRDWWQPYSRMLSERHSTYIGLETEAVSLWTFELAIVPGLLQTEDYARALMRRGAIEIDEEEVERRVQLRVERQQILTGNDPVQLFAVIDEAVLHRQVGGEQIMRAQLDHLAEVARLPGVTLQVIPFSVGQHPGTGGNFTILSFAHGDPDAVYVETIGGELLVEEHSEVKRYKAASLRLTADALSPQATIAMVARDR
jgi:transcriptional regulator with XRE-family HTH domain